MRHKDKHTPSSVAANMGWDYSYSQYLDSAPRRHVHKAQTLRRILFADASSSVPATKMKAQTLKPICLISTVPAPTSAACVILAIALLRLRREPLHTTYLSAAESLCSVYNKQASMSSAGGIGVGGTAGTTGVGSLLSRLSCVAPSDL